MKSGRSISYSETIKPFVASLITDERFTYFFHKIRPSKLLSIDYFLAIYVHVLLIVAIFDVYYKSPLVVNSDHRFQNDSQGSGGWAGANILTFSDQNPPADRLVIFVADGLRSETFFDYGTSAPFLKNISKKGIWGLNNCRVPTESRPGHVALLAGFYEDVSAVTRGWTENPVQFDSIFNQSQFSFMWGSPDIVPMFSKGVYPKNKVFTKTYSSKLQDFADENASILDNWVFDEVKNFFHVAVPKNATLADLVHKKRKKIVFFLHLLATDTLGHGFKPRSFNYIDNIANVDRGVERIYDLIEKFYDRDGRTAYLFLSDHGMTDWGSHGAGDPHETETPFVAWGAGVVSENKSPNPILRSQNPNSPKLFNSIEQIDVAPWISCILGFDGPPYNSLGVAPVRFLNANDEYKARCACANFLTIADQMMVKRREKLDANFKSLFREYSTLSSNKLQAIKNQIFKLFAQKRYTLASNVCLEWIKPTISALKFYHQYERTFLTFFIVSIYISWTTYVLCKLVLGNEPNNNYQMRKWISIVSATVICSYLLFTKQPLHYFLYCLTPVFFLSKFLRYVSWFSCRCLGKLLLTLIFVQIFVLCFFYRIVLTLILFTVALYHLALNGSSNLRFVFMLSINAIFPCLPTVGRYYFRICPILVSACFIIYILKTKAQDDKFAKQNVILTGSTIFVQILVSCDVLSFLYHSISWLTLIFTLKTMYSNSRTFLSLCFLLYPMYTLLSAFYEPLFYCTFCLLLHNFQNSLNSGIFKRGFVVVFLCLLAFFGTGNLASLNSYDPTLTKPFVTVFSPFLMTSLLLTKVSIPILLVLSSVVEMNGKNDHNSTKNSFWFYVVLCDLMAMNFYFALKDDGSWLDIGTSISHYILSMAMPLVIISLQQLAVHLIRPKYDRRIMDVE
uniref:GPI ethanolamine phosphate transferase 1 n=1 Tax=Romanomermis culicivorax TaxID=13658 RepID=A0A915J940_ROMCU